MKKTLKTLLKTASYRIFSAGETFAVSYLLTGQASAATGIVAAELFLKGFSFAAHEAMWESSWAAKFFGPVGVVE